MPRLYGRDGGSQGTAQRLTVCRLPASQRKVHGSSGSSGPVGVAQGTHCTASARWGRRRACVCGSFHTPRHHWHPAGKSASVPGRRLASGPLQGPEAGEPAYPHQQPFSSQVILKPEARQIGEFFQTDAPSALQFAVGIQGGAEKMAHLAHLLLDAHPPSLDNEDPFCIITLDLSNAFNELSRQLIQDVLNGRALRDYALGCIKEGDPMPSTHTMGSTLTSLSWVVTVRATAWPRPLGCNRGMCGGPHFSVRASTPY
mmetsp:Transcript_47046/g.113006  ORF Transcript_47046/g.113006 Transcript_47046/m.113006 type:complete len:257 (-) Transcript_47046:672-1442(-)